MWCLCFVSFAPFPDDLTSMFLYCDCLILEFSASFDWIQFLRWLRDGSTAEWFRSFDLNIWCWRKYMCEDDIQYTLRKGVWIHGGETSCCLFNKLYHWDADECPFRSSWSFSLSNAMHWWIFFGLMFRWYP